MTSSELSYGVVIMLFALFEAPCLCDIFDADREQADSFQYVDTLNSMFVDSYRLPIYSHSLTTNCTRWGRYWYLGAVGGLTPVFAGRDISLIFDSRCSWGMGCCQGRLGCCNPDCSSNQWQLFCSLFKHLIHHPCFDVHTLGAWIVNLPDDVGSKSQYDYNSTQ
jgi:hypothetical protein